MAWLAVNKDESEVIFNEYPFNCMCGMEADEWLCQDQHGENLGTVFLPKGTIKKLIGRELTWEDEPVEI